MVLAFKYFCTYNYKKVSQKGKMKETPQEIVVFLRQHKSSLEIAKAVGCSQELINKIASGERQNPRYQIMDGLRDLAKAVKRKTPRGNVGRV